MRSVRNIMQAICGNEHREISGRWQPGYGAQSRIELFAESFGDLKIGE
ncbi:MAG: hypothetical protein KTR26_10440 [Flammeovirgaceae bacterium]|nr:hypothetical protein [Flammeovirgaceae bacterium]